MLRGEGFDRNSFTGSLSLWHEVTLLASGSFVRLAYPATELKAITSLNRLTRRDSFATITPAHEAEVVPAMPKHNPHLDEETLVEKEEKVEKPPLYKVLMHNDDFTAMEFVVFVLIEVFHQAEAVAEQIMYAVHEKGVGIAGVFTREIAETKINQAHNLARAHEYPLLCTMEEE